MEEKKKTKRNILPSLIIALAVLAITIGIGLLLANGNKKGAGGNIDPDKPYNPNKVVLDGFTFAPLKLEAGETNLVYSPLSIKYALSMLSEGAKGETKEEIDNLIKDLGLTKYENIDKVLSLANSIFIRNIYSDKIKTDYINSLKEKFNAEVIFDEFNNAENVNKWIEDKTFGIIKNMLRDEQVQNPDVKILLINALAIDMGWLDTFSPENTTSRPFKRADGKEVNVAMMHKTSEYNEFYQDENYSVLSLPFKDYNDTSLEFIAIMPNEGNLKEMITKDDMNTTISSLLDKLHKPSNQELSISIPRFEYEYKTSLKNDLIEMGIKKAFGGDADFSLIGDTGLSVDDVIHKANIKCSEKGVKAAAATVIIMKDGAMIQEDPKEIIYLNYNKPFMYVIRDTKTKEVWFVGTVYEPLLWDNTKGDYNYQ